MTKIDKIKEKILKLRAMIPDRGATEEEALSALMKADALMAEHSLTEDDLNLAEAKRDMSHGEYGYGIKTQHPCGKWCSKTIGQFCGVITWYSVDSQKSNGFGFNADVEMYQFLLKMIHDSMNRSWKDYLAVNPKKPGLSRHTEYWSFMLGFSQSVNAKLLELMNAREVVAEATGTELVVKKWAIVEAGLSEMMPSLHLSKSRSSGIKAHEGAIGQGRAAGSKVNLNRPIQQGPGGRKQIV